MSDYSSYIRSFIRIRDERVAALVTSCLDQGRLWPDPLIQLNPSFQYARTVDDLGAEGVLQSEYARVFRAGKDKGEGKPLPLPWKDPSRPAGGRWLARVLGPVKYAPRNGRKNDQQSRRGCAPENPCHAQTGA